MIQRAQLEAEEDRIPGQTGFGRGDADIRGVIARDVSRVRPHNHDNYKGLSVNRVTGNHQDWAASGLFAALDRIQRVAVQPIVALCLSR